MEAQQKAQLLTNDVKALADAVSLQLQHASRLWAFGATISIFVIAADFSGGKAEILGFGIAKEWLYPLLTVLSAAINISFCASSLQAYRTAIINLDYLDSIGAIKTKFSQNYTLSDAAHTLYVSAFSRVYPFTHFLPRAWGRLVYMIFKTVSDAVYFW